MGKAGTAADIFTWAVTVAYAASGQPPFGTGTSDVILYRIVHAVPDITAVPDGLRPLVEAALAKEPGDRPTAPQLLSQLTQSTAARSAAGASVGYGNPTQTILAQTWHPSAPGSAVPPPHPTVPPPDTAPPVGDRSSRRRTALLPVVLTLAFLLAAGGTAVGFALAGGSGGTHGPRAPARRRPGRAAHPSHHARHHDDAAHRPGHHDPGYHRPDHHDPGYHRSDYHRPDHHCPDYHCPGHHRPGHHARHHDDAAHHDPDHHGDGHHDPDQHGRIAACGPGGRQLHRRRPYVRA